MCMWQCGAALAVTIFNGQSLSVSQPHGPPLYTARCETSRTSGQMRHDMSMGDACYVFRWLRHVDGLCGVRVEWGR